MTNPIGYWCPLCGDLPTTSNPFPWMPGQAWHHGVCDFRAIPIYRPLDVPEVTTWGESGGDSAVTLHVNIITPLWMLGDDHARVVDNYANRYWMAGPRHITDGDVVEAMNFLAGAK